jgi:hypothetical protein
LNVALLALLIQAAPLKVAAPGLSYVGISPALGEVYLERFATVLGASGELHVTTARDIAQVLGLERQRELLGCTDASSSCLAELAGGLGVDLVLGGSLAKTGSFITVTLRVVKATDGSEIASSSTRVKDEDALQEWLERNAPILRADILAAMGVRAVTLSESPKWQRWLPGVLGVAMLAGGSVCYGLAAGKAGMLQQASDGQRSLSPSDIQGTATAGRTLNDVGLGLLIGGAVAIAVSALWVLLTR